MAGSSAQITFAFLAKDAASKSINAIGRNLKGLGSTAKNVARGVAIGMAAIAASTAAALGYAIKQASDFNETLSKTRVVLGDASGAVEAFAKTAATTLGLSETEALNAASTFAIFGKSAGLSGDSLAGFSTELTSLAADFGSFYNASNEEAITAIGAALRGETEPIRRFGVLLDDATLRQRAFAMGLIKTTKEALTPQNKVLAAQAEILDSARRTGSMGDFANTFGGSFPNQIKALRANFANLTKDIGKSFLPAILKVFKALTPVFDDLFKGVNKETPKMEKFANTIADKLVKNIPKWVATAKRELPPLIDKVKEFFLEATKFADGAVKALGPEGLITAGIAAIGFKIGGLKGALAGALTKGFSDVGFGPFESLILGSVSSAVLAGLAQGLASQAALALIAAFKVRMTAAATIPTPIPGTTPGPGGGGPPIAPIPGGGGTSIIPKVGFGLGMLGQFAMIPEKFGQTLDNIASIFGDKEASARQDAFWKQRGADQELWNPFDWLAMAVGLDKLGIWTLPTAPPVAPPVDVHQRVDVILDGEKLGQAFVDWTLAHPESPPRRG